MEPPVTSTNALETASTTNPPDISHRRRISGYAAPYTKLSLHLAAASSHGAFGGVSGAQARGLSLTMNEGPEFRLELRRGANSVLQVIRDALFPNILALTKMAGVNYGCFMKHQCRKLTSTPSLKRFVASLTRRMGSLWQRDRPSKNLTTATTVPSEWSRGATLDPDPVSGRA